MRTHPHHVAGGVAVRASPTGDIIESPSHSSPIAPEQHEEHDQQSLPAASLAQAGAGRSNSSPHHPACSLAAYTLPVSFHQFPRPLGSEFGERATCPLPEFTPTHPPRTRILHVTRTRKTFIANKPALLTFRLSHPSKRSLAPHPPFPARVLQPLARFETNLHLPHARTATTTMPRVTISVSDPNQALDGELLTLDLPPDTSLTDFRGFVQAETGVPTAIQQFYLNGQPLAADSRTLEDAGIKDGEMLAMLVNRGSVQPQNRGGASSSSGVNRGQQNQRRGPSRPSADQIETIRLQFLADPSRLAAMRSQAPDLFEAREDGARFREVWERRVTEEERIQRERQNQIALLNEDPFNVEAQMKIEEMIRQENVMQNLQEAYEATPEVFGRVTMLYIPTLVNGRPVKAFVDSGAQATIMSPSCAEACGLTRLIDTRYSGIARGVGTAKIIGRVHKAEIRIGSMSMDCAFTVMEGKDVDLLFGLDNLKRFRACIDLKKNCLVLEGTEVAFLGEADIPKTQDDAMEDEPTFQGPNGTEIGAKTGAVKPAGTSAAAHEHVAGQKSGSGSSSAGPSGTTAAAAGSSSAAPGNFSGQGRTLGNGGGQPQQQAQGQPQAPQQQRPSWPKTSIDQLQALGFSIEEATAALDATDGNVELAAGLLLS